MKQLYSFRYLLFLAFLWGCLAGILGLLTIPAHAQDLLQSRQSSYFTYIYQLTDQEAEKIYREKPTNINKNYFHTLVDSFPTDTSLEKSLPRGHYLKTFAAQNQQVNTLLSIQNIQLFILNNEQDLLLQLLDTDGQLITDAQVRLGNKKLRFDAATQSYQDRKSNQEGLLIVKHKESTSFFELSKQQDNPWIRRTSKNILYQSPVQYVWKPIYFVLSLPVDAYKSIKWHSTTGSIYQTAHFFERAYHRTACLFNPSHCNWRRYNLPSTKGYLVFNKPKYMPQDSVFFKAFITNAKGKPTQTEVDTYLLGADQPTFLGQLKSYRKGAFEHRFYLHDSLGLKLDKSYRLVLRNKNKQPLLFEEFYYEAYELNKIHLDVRTDQPTHQQNEALKLQVSAKDENGLFLKDARIEILLVTDQATSFHQPIAFIPDTLARFSKELIPDKITEVLIQADEFPPADFNYTIDVRLLTADNESAKKNIQVSYKHDSDPFLLDFTQDSLIVKRNPLNSSSDNFAQLIGMDAFGNEQLLMQDRLPFSHPIHTQYVGFKVQSAQQFQAFDWNGANPLLEMFAERNSKNLSIQVRNPRNLPFSYHLFKKNTPVTSSYSKSLALDYKTHSKQNYYLNINYLWAGEMKQETYQISFKKKQLNILVEEPLIITPGQEAAIQIQVTDSKKRPLKDVDITAFALTKKFGFTPPKVPNVEKPRPGKLFINSFSANKTSELRNTQPLDYRTWKLLAEIDSIEFYKFMYPEQEMYRFLTQAPEGLTQAAPFLFIDGKPEAPSIIYIDNVPVYFAWNSIQNPYAFPINPGKHQVKIRTPHYLITFDDLIFEEGMKTIFSIDVAKYQGKFTKELQKPVLTEEEKASLYPYVFPLRNIPTERMAYLKKGNQIYFLGMPGTQFGNRLFTGPIYGDFSYQVVNGYTHKLRHEPRMEYEFFPTVVKMREMQTSAYPKNLYTQARYLPLEDFAWTEKKLVETWEKHLEDKRRESLVFRYPQYSRRNTGKLWLDLIQNDGQKPNNPISIVLRNKENPLDLWVYSGNQRRMTNLSQGIYELTLFFPGMHYHHVDSVEIKENGWNYFQLSAATKEKKDVFSSEVAQALEHYVFAKTISISEETKLISELNKSYFHKFQYDGPGQLVSGYVLDKQDSEPLPGAMVMIKGTNFGTTTDRNGFFSLAVPFDKNTLVFAFIGYFQKEVTIDQINQDSFYLEADYSPLYEVVVTGYAASNKESMIFGSSVISTLNFSESMSYSDALQGQVMGIANGSESSRQIFIRGLASSKANELPLIILDGTVFLGDITSINSAEIISMELLTKEEAIKKYGESATHGALLIRTMKGSMQDSEWGEALKTKNTLRQNFSDAAFWQPTLRTDKEGKVSFKTTFPDDLTSWQTIYLAMNDRKQTGQTNGQIKAILPLAAQLSIPRFLVSNDTALVLGKSINYISDSTFIHRSFQVNGKLASNTKGYLSQILIDSVQVVAKDSLSISYQLLRESDGYKDGELRSIPIFPKGMLRTQGHFAVLNGDTVLQIQKDPNLTSGTLFLRSDIRSVLEEETQFLYAYKYECNEQLASKLKGLLAMQELAAFNNKPFEETKELTRIIRLLEKNQGEKGLWGWWKNSSGNLWITLHVIEALVKAQEKGFPLSINQSKLEQQLIWELEYADNFDSKLRIGQAFLVLGTAFDSPALIRTLESSMKGSLMEDLRLMEFKTQLGLPVSMESVMRYQQSSILGNTYIGNATSYTDIWTNDVQSTLLAYKILKKLQPDAQEMLRSMQNYLLEKRGTKGWTNTYESAQIIETILPDVLAMQSKGQLSVRLEGIENQTVINFPMEYTLESNEAISLVKTGKEPLYYSYVEQFWEENPEKSDGIFEIHSSFSDGSQLHLEAGKEVTIDVQIKVHEDASYVMINIPIPGSCSYGEKRIAHRQESHREYFLQETAIFCERLPKGDHTFSVNILPRYTGTYTLNPATIELMYFPTIQANEQVKTVIVAGEVKK
ncbi:carboxypeptidase-like regulatory domain-containing protein [Mongoliitalea daihaiensis]|uniref:carboxypeptidase-like regulatory domain-containing protein n=1 Tax=Mongoliitalea daihaiensis TaxID=2782006 RepID=UPI001F4030C6|nr:carboxypeptidase-like regulatory domain-containing protein [Mongoliitalea daihaiensis]UJP64691.1 carboxypeptidase-like regulatory domain-containing protein [Mongoliitalea daihaiensis]